MTRLRSVFLIVSIALAACGGGSNDAAIDAQPTVVALAAKGAAAARVASLSLPSTTIAMVGAPLTLTAVAKDKSGATLSGTRLTWTSADASIATVDALGTVSPLRAGFTTIRASAGNVSASTTLSVRGTTPIPVRSSSVGTNLSGIAYYSTQFPFVYLMKSGSGWSSYEDGGVWGGAFPGLRSDGYPSSLKTGQHAYSAVAWNDTHYPAGRYVVLWDGDGTISFPMSQVSVAQSQANRIAIDVAVNGGALWVGIDRTDPSNPVRNLRFLTPGAETTYATRPFNPAFLARTAPFSTLRFMDWGATNGSPLVAWADRPLATDLTYGSGKGVPVEVMIDLANWLHVDPWFCIPHQASDDYVKQFATLLHNRLDPGLRPHVEYSNEVWNTGFSQTTWAVQRSAALGLPVAYGQPAAFYAQRSVQIFKIMRQVYGTDSVRLVRVLAGQAAWTNFLDNALAWQDTALNADATAVAPYFGAGVSDEATALALTSDQIVDRMLANVQGEVKNWMMASAAQARRYNLPMKGYESGPGDTTFQFSADKQATITALFAAANHSPRMRDVYRAYYEQWIAAGGQTMNQYHDIGGWSIYGFWGALEYVTQPPTDAPKYQGLLDVIAAHPTP